MQYAGIIIDISHEKLDRIFHYRIPDRLAGTIRPGSRVLIPFGKGNRISKGYVVELTDEPGFDPGRIKELLGTDESENRIESDLIALAWEIRARYGGTMNQALRTVLPVRKKTAPRQRKMLHLRVPVPEGKAMLAEMERKHQTARARLLSALLEQSPIPGEIAAGKLHVSADAVRALEERGILFVETVRDYRNPCDFVRQTKNPPRLNETQKRIAEDILQRMETGDRRPSLIFGVTGSGKTEVYMKLIEGMLEKKRQAIVLIPEIALTWQTLLRFYQRFGDRVSAIHSRMSDGERQDQFERAEKGEVDIMVGPRSAIFTPFENPGLVVIDEEHESTYQNEHTPRYDVREVARIRMRQHGGIVVFGSATPSVETFYQAQKGGCELYEMPGRVQERPMPAVEICDLRRELREGNRSVFSRTLYRKMRERLENHEQIMLFLNRRGLAGFLSCRSCGNVIKCPHCDISLSLHKDGRMRCHYCGYEQEAVKCCPVCGSAGIGGFRSGTQKIEQLVRREFPDARVLRMDYDTTRKKGGYEQILSAFAERKADILIGTQMIVKGHDFPAVTLVGILAADLSLFVPDFRSGERTFQLLTQAAGRAGRGDRPGEVVIQTYQPEHYSILSAASGNYQEFYRQEILFRRMMRYPPVWSMLTVRVESRSEEEAQAWITKSSDFLIRELRVQKEENSGIHWQMIGPADASVSKINDRYRKELSVKHSTRKALSNLRERLEQHLEKEGPPDHLIIQMEFR